MGTYALSAGYYDAFYKRAQQVWANMTLKEIVEIVGVILWTLLWT